MVHCVDYRSTVEGENECEGDNIVNDRRRRVRLCTLSSELSG